jgi:hypothetical protein
MARDAAQRYPAAADVDEEQDIVDHQSSPGQHLLRNKTLDLLEIKDFAFRAFQPTHAPSRLCFFPSKPGAPGQLLHGEEVCAREHVHVGSCRPG